MKPRAAIATDSFQNARFSVGLVGLLALFGFGCGGPLQTGTAKQPVNDKPGADGSCPAGESRCGVGTFAVCADLQGDPRHCGDCDRACTEGIACAVGVCQQTVCTSTSSAFSGEPTPPVTFDSSIHGRNVLADINGDGRADRVTWIAPYASDDPHPELREFHVSLGLPEGEFAAAETYTATFKVVEILGEDVNGDGFEDLFVFSSRDYDATTTPFNTEWWFGTKDGHLRRGAETSATSTMPQTGLGAFSVADLSGDGWPDIVLQERQDWTGTLGVLLSDSTGALHLSRTYTTQWLMRTLIRDWDGDGDPDIAIIDGWSKFSILYNHGDGTFMDPIDCGITLSVGYDSALLAEDFDRDGRVDLAFAISDRRMGVMLGLGACGFTAITRYDIPGLLTPKLRAADMNGDGRLDIIALSAVTGSNGSIPEDQLLTLLIGNGDGTFTIQSPSFSLGPDISDISVGETSGDQRPDITLSSPDGQTRTWKNDCQ